MSHGVLDQFLENVGQGTPAFLVLNIVEGFLHELLDPNVVILYQLYKLVFGFI